MDFDYDEDLVGEAPCEFCGESYPLILLIQHQSTHLGDNENYTFFDEDERNTETENIITELRKTEIIETIELDSPIKIIEPEEKKTKSSDVKKEPKIAVEQKQTQSSIIKNEKKGVNSKNEKIKEFTTESGEKLLIYGSDIDPGRDLESEKQMFKMPNNPLLSSLCNEKDEEDINNLSDDDSSESLEEFWKRARDVLKRNRVKSDC